MIGDAQALGLALRRGVRNCRVCGVMITITVGTSVAVWFMKMRCHQLLHSEIFC